MDASGDIKDSSEIEPDTALISCELFRMWKSTCIPVVRTGIRSALPPGLQTDDIQREIMLLECLDLLANV
jgi:hypothetical protein